MTTIVSDKHSVVVGLGKTGLSCVRYLKRLGRQITVMDSREQPPGLDELNQDYPGVRQVLGGFDEEVLITADEIVISPGVPVYTPEIQKAKDAGISIRGDIDLFAEAANAPIVAITGSNGKSTVTTLVGEMAVAAGLNVAVGGNLGEPALDLLADNVDWYVLELSSFQLETTRKLNAFCATLLNISEDHMDRYPGKMEYLQAKQRIFFGAKNVVINDDEALSHPLVSKEMVLHHFGVGSSDLKKFSIIETQEGSFLAKGFETLISTEDVSLKGHHNYSNALASLCIGNVMNLPMSAMLSVLKTFGGLAHRCQFVREIDGVTFINDSKGTNVGATVAAIDGFSVKNRANIILIAGGDAKGSDLTPVGPAMQSAGKKAVLFGRDAALLGDVLEKVVETIKVDGLKVAVAEAYKGAERGDVVLFSPACASLDMFKNYEHRGNSFMEEVAAL